jgi:transcriptional regulator with XRE-family HTH domain
MSGGRYNGSMTVSRRFPLAPRTLANQLAAIVRDARLAMGWTQDELASRVGTSQTRIWRLERGDSSAFDPTLIDDVFGALGVRLNVDVAARHLDDRARQRDAVHARLLERVAGRLRAAGWSILTEVPVGGEPPRGWADLLGFREHDASLAVGELKTAILDAGELQRQMSFYLREAPWAARRAGWQPRRIVGFVVALDTDLVAEALRANGGLLRGAFPGKPDEFLAWLESPRVEPPRGVTVVVSDLARHQGIGLRASALHTRSMRTAYADYADAAAALAETRALSHRGARRGRSALPSARIRQEVERNVAG